MKLMYFWVHELSLKSCLFKHNEICSGAKKINFLKQDSVDEQVYAMYCTWYLYHFCNVMNKVNLNSISGVFILPV